MRTPFVGYGGKYDRVDDRGVFLMSSSQTNMAPAHAKGEFTSRVRFLAAERLSILIRFCRHMASFSPNAFCGFGLEGTRRLTFNSTPHFSSRDSYTPYLSPTYDQ